VFAEFMIETPYPRGESFRTSSEYVGYCRDVAAALSAASAGGGGP
jgi:NitT/TauT family transport system ATP-binding protein